MQLLISTFFEVENFDCHDGTDYPVDWIEQRLQPLATMLDVIRRAYGGPLGVVSGYRTEEYNRKISGAGDSRHCHGDAADIRPVNIQLSARPAAVARLFQVTQTLLANGSLPRLGGLGYYPGKWIHVDTRPRPPSGHIAKWEGTGIGSEQTA